jgi:hypothetical protein
MSAATAVCASLPDSLTWRHSPFAMVVRFGARPFYFLLFFSCVACFEVLIFVCCTFRGSKGTQVGWVIASGCM